MHRAHAGRDTAAQRAARDDDDLMLPQPAAAAPAGGDLSEPEARTIDASDLGLSSGGSGGETELDPRATARPRGFDSALAPEGGHVDDFSGVLADVPFRAIDDDADSSGRSSAEWGGVHFTRAQSASASPSPRPSRPRAGGRNGGADEDSAMCRTLAAENRQLRRRLDEADFRLAELEMGQQRDSGGSPPERDSSASSAGGGSGASPWKRIAARVSFTGMSSSRKPSERARLRSEVRALAVTAEYLWRKLSATEKELEDVRALGVNGSAGMQEWDDPYGQGTEFGAGRRVDPGAMLQRK